MAERVCVCACVGEVCLSLHGDDGGVQEPGYYKMHQEALLEADADADDDDDALLYPSN